jgi:hypothetical protein
MRSPYIWREADNFERFIIVLGMILIVLLTLWGVR